MLNYVVGAPGLHPAVVGQDTLISQDTLNNSSLHRGV